MESFLTLPQKELGQLLALLMALGYVDINVVSFRAERFYFVLRGPLFSRLTSGSPPLLRSPGNAPNDGITTQAFTQVEAILAYLLFTEQAYVYNPTIVGAGIVFTVQSEWFNFSTLHELLEKRRSRSLDRTILALLNLAVGIGLLKNTFGITGTAYRPFGYRLGFSATSDLMQPNGHGGINGFGLTSIPNGGPVYRVFNQVIGALMAFQLLKIYGFSVGKGGRVVFNMTGDILKLRVFPKILEKWSKERSFAALASSGGGVRSARRVSTKRRRSRRKRTLARRKRVMSRR